MKTNHLKNIKNSIEKKTHHSKFIIAINKYYDCFFPTNFPILWGHIQNNLHRIALHIDMSVMIENIRDSFEYILLYDTSTFIENDENWENIKFIVGCVDGFR